MFPIIKYLKFILAASNEHGVHSPFIYDYLVQCLYQKPRRHKNRTLDVMLKSIPYFNAKNIYLSEDETAVRKLLGHLYPGMRFNHPPFDLVYWREPYQGLDSELLKSGKSLHNNTVCIVDHLYKTRIAASQWEAIKCLDSVSVTIDTFFCGIVFFRKEQAPQHFKIRI